MTFEEWLDDNEVVSELEPAWISDARIVWYAATLVEREACAKVCEDQANEPECPERARYCADAIRNRSNA